uniref:Putative secreted protein n=1 Tax=Ixodes ricinus TaxID=34613 RepID=A0A6B0UBY1_IXORI
MMIPFMFLMTLHLVPVYSATFVGKLHMLGTSRLSRHSLYLHVVHLEFSVVRLVTTSFPTCFSSGCITQQVCTCQNASQLQAPCGGSPFCKHS